MTPETPYRLVAAMILAILAIASMHAQESILGKVFDTQGEPLSYVNVLLLNPADSSLVQGNLTDEEGAFSLLEVSPGAYIVRVAMIGYVDYNSDVITLSDQPGPFQIPDVTLREDSYQLEEAEIVADKILFEQKIDRLVVNVGTSVTFAGTSALEVLKRSPGVMIDPQSSLISMNGKSGVVIMIDGRITRMPMDAVLRMLDGMNSDNIEAIELIHTPPANYEAEGNAGFINIRLKNNPDEGLNGGFSVKAGYGRKEKAGAAVNFNYRKEKVNLYGDYSFDHDNSTQLFRNYRGFERNDTIFETNGDSDRDPTLTQTHIARLGLDYNLSSNTILGVLTSYAATRWDMDAINHVDMFEDGMKVSGIEIPNTEINNTDKFLVNLNLQQTFNEGRQLNVDLDYNYFYNDNPSDYINLFYDESGNLVGETGLRVQKTTPMNIYVGKVDYFDNSGEKFTWSTGAKAVSTHFDNDIYVEEFANGEWHFAPEYSSLAEMTEDILAGYFSATWKIDEKTEMQAGLRYEYTNSQLSTVEDPDLVDRQYGKLFPTVFLSRKINENNTLQLSYNRRIRRPSFRQLAPFFIFTDPTTIITGNPQLQPAISDAVRIAYQWKSLQWSADYTYIDDPIGAWQPRVNTENNTQILQPKNLIDSHVATSTVSFPIYVKDWWEIRSSWTAQWAQFRDIVDDEEYTLANWSWYMNGSSVFKLPRKYTLEISGRYFSNQPGGVVTWQGTGALDIGIQKEFNNNGGTLRLAATNIFNGLNWHGVVDDPEIDFQYRGEYNIGEPVVMLSYAKQFGKKDVKGARKRQTGSAEEQARTN